MRLMSLWSGLALVLLSPLGSLLSGQVEKAEGPVLQLAIEGELRERLSREIASPLDIDLIMLGEEFSGTKPSSLNFSLNGQTIYFRWRAPLEEKPGLYAADQDGGNLRRLPDDEKPIFHSGLRWNQARDKAVFSHEGMIYQIALGGKEEPLMPSLGGLKLRGMDGSGDRVVFQVGDNLYAYATKTRELQQLTRIESKPTEKKEDDRESLLRATELELFLHLHREKEQREEALSKAAREEKLEAWEPRKGFELERSLFSPDLGRVLLILGSTKPGTRTKMPRYISEDGYVSQFESRPKVGDDSYRAELVLLDTATGKNVDLKLADVLPFEDYSVGRVAFSPEGERVLLLLRSRDNKRAALVEILREGSVRLVHLVEDDAWVRHVGDDLGFLMDGRLWFSSEKSGFNHLYIETAIGAEIKQRTVGNWLIDDLEYRRDLDRFLVRSSRKSPHSRQIEILAPDGKTNDYEPVFDAEGMVEAQLSPDAKTLVLIQSESNRPDEVYVRALAADSKSKGKPVTSSPSPAFKSRAWLKPEIGSFRARDGAEVPFRLYRPERLEAGGKAVVFVHGAGYLQNVHWGWSGYFREYMFHNLLVERGYVVIDVDYRGSAGYGRDWRCAIYRRMGGLDLSDQVDAARYLTENLNIDPKRIGIYGGSYGGFITLMALFREPGVFQAGAALRPVTDWAHYNHGYTANILNRPQDDAEAYRFSSPIHYAQGLEGRLLICHGLEDDNVHPQDSIRLAQRLIELRKTGWELALYPVEPHGFRDPQSWADEYKRILNLFESSLKKLP